MSTKALAAVFQPKPPAPPKADVAARKPEISKAALLAAQNRPEISETIAVSVAPSRVAVAASIAAAAALNEPAWPAPFSPFALPIEITGMSVSPILINAGIPLAHPIYEHLWPTCLPT